MKKPYSINHYKKGVRSERQLRESLLNLQKIHNIYYQQGEGNEVILAATAQAVHTLRYALNLEPYMRIEKSSLEMLKRFGLIHEGNHFNRKEADKKFPTIRV